jgi:hypothetical protein
MIFASGSPTEVEDLRTSDFWKVIYLIQVPFLVISPIMMFFYHKYESLRHYVQRGQKDTAMIILGRIYPNEQNATREAIYN